MGEKDQVILTPKEDMSLPTERFAAARKAFVFSSTSSKGYAAK